VKQIIHGVNAVHGKRWPQVAHSHHLQLFYAGHAPTITGADRLILQP
jgi:hypothetical protein